MLNLLLYLVILPFLWLLSPLRPQAKGALLIHTARIGDYVNASVLLGQNAPLDVLISEVNRPFSARDPRIHTIFLFESVRRGLWNRLRFARKLYWRNYQSVWVTTPSALNALFGLFAFTPGAVIVKPYRAGKTVRMMMKFYPRCQPHGREDLTIDTFLRMAGQEPTEVSWKSRQIIPQVESQRVNRKLKETLGNWRVGISIAAHNRSKLIPHSEWCWLIQAIASRGGLLFPIGLAEDQTYLTEILNRCPEYKEAVVEGFLGRIDLVDLPDNLAELDLIIGADSGPLYIADSVGTPVIVYAGLCNLPEQRPLGPDTFIIPPPKPVEKKTYVFDTLHNIQATNLYLTEQTMRQKVEAHLDQLKATVDRG